MNPCDTNNHGDREGGCSRHIYPGTPWHQALLAHIDLYYRAEPRLLALTLFGSLARGSWDQYSDIDLNVVVRDDARIDTLAEVRRLCASLEAIGERPLLIVPNKTDAADVVLASLHEFSIRYHPLAATSSNIVESVRVLHGTISLETVQAAGRANIALPVTVEADPVDAFLRLALAVDREVRRRHLWTALSLLEGMRTLVVEMFASAQGGGRPFSVFQAGAPAVLHEKLAATLPQSTFASLKRALTNLLEIVEKEHRQLGSANGLSLEQLSLLTKVKQQQR